MVLNQNDVKIIITKKSFGKTDMYIYIYNS